MEAYIGTILLFAGNFAPKGWAFCDGKLLNIQGNEAVFSIVGTQYGGDGMHNFALPNLPNVGDTRYIFCMEGIYPSRD
uniref:Phage tail collar domain-containing protein n=1 Tax=Candidatus Nitrotoga fabula TaxID=2182327 RepID=A0A2X0SK75_9PROT|nr:conserved protein of unknown function [Candidatus Nitrotoga fabula]